MENGGGRRLRKSSSSRVPSSSSGVDRPLRKHATTKVVGSSTASTHDQKHDQQLRRRHTHAVRRHHQMAHSASSSDHLEFLRRMNSSFRLELEERRHKPTLARYAPCDFGGCYWMDE